MDSDQIAGLGCFGYFGDLNEEALGGSFFAFSFFINWEWFELFGRFWLGPFSFVGVGK